MTRQSALPWLVLLPCLVAFTASTPVAAQVRDRVSVVGSSTVYPFATAVAETVGRTSRWKTPVVESTGTGGGFQAFCRGLGAGTPDVIDASRPMMPSEKLVCDRNRVGPIAAFRIGSDGIVIASDRRAIPFDLTREQLYRAVAKTVVRGGQLVPNPYRRWSDVHPSLPNRPIVVIGPAPNHGTRDAFAALAMLPPCERIPEIRALDPTARSRVCQAVREDGAWIDVVADYAILFDRLTGNPDAVGVLTYSYLDRNRDRLQAARIDGVAPTLETIGAWRYPMSRPLFLYVKRAHVGAVPGLAEYVQEFVSARAAGPDGYLADLGLAPLPAAWLEVERQKALELATPRR